jgi:hypothetical protein
MSLFKKFPSLSDLFRGAISTFKRFPLALLCAFILTIVMVKLVSQNGNSLEGSLARIAIPSALGISLQIALTTWSEKRGFGISARYIIQLGGIALLTAYYFSLPPNPTIAMMFLIRSLIIAILLHALVSFVPFLGSGQMNGFWQYNKSLFLRILFSALYSAVLYIGLAIALLAAKELFGMDIPGQRFLQLWFIIAIIFNTWVFLAGIPLELEELNRNESYPKALKVFSQYILLPLVALYLLILYAYELKIIINWKWPTGWVSQLVLWYSVVGILSMLLLWPLRDLMENRWIRNYAKWFFRALIPLVIMLFFAITERIGDYGVTVNRYLVIALATGLALVTLYFVISRKKDIRLIPIILSIIALLSAYGPWNAFAVARHSQQERLDKMLKDEGLFKDGKIVTELKEISMEKVKDLSSIVSYLVEYHGARAFSPWLPESSLALIDTSQNRWAINDSVSSMLGFQYTNRWEESADRLAFELPESVTVSVENYTRMIRFTRYVYDSLSVKANFMLNQDTLSIWLKKRPAALCFEIKAASSHSNAPCEFDLIPLMTSIASARANGTDTVISAPELTIGNYYLKMITKEFNGNRIKDTVEVYNYSAYILARKME